MQPAVRFMAIVVLALPTLPAAADLVAHYEFSHDFLDSSGKAGHGNPSTTLGFVEGPAGFGAALALSNGVYLAGPHYPEPPQYVDCADVEGPPRSQALTVTVWLKCAARASADADVIISGGTATNGWRLFREPRFNYLSLDFWGPNWGGGGGGGPVVADGRWHHYALAMVGGASRVFVDGEPKGSGGGAPVPAPLRLTPMRIGGQARLNAYFSGCLDDLRVYDEALSQSQIVAIMTPPPVLRIAWQGDQLLVSWPTRAGDFLLEACTGAPESAAWQPVEGTTVRSYDAWQTAVDNASPACFFRLRQR